MQLPTEEEIKNTLHDEWKYITGEAPEKGTFECRLIECMVQERLSAATELQILKEQLK